MKHLMRPFTRKTLTGTLECLYTVEMTNETNYTQDVHNHLLYVMY